jgi:hypothetical protein
MMRTLSLVAALLVALATSQAVSAQTTPQADLVRQAVAAAGGVDGLRGVKRLSISGTAKQWEPEQSFVAGGEPRFLGDSTFSVVWDLEKGIARTDWDRAMQYPFAAHDKYTEIVTPALGWVVDAKGDRPMSGIRVAAHLREFERASPTLLLKALDAPQTIAALPDQVLGHEKLPAVAVADGGTKFTILFDPETHLPAAIRTLDDDNIHGDSNYDLILADWKVVGGARVAHSLTYKLDSLDIAKLVYTKVTVDPPIPSETFAVPDQIKATAKPPASGNVPYQWVLRRLNLGRFTDSDAVNFAVGGSLKLVELSPNVQQVVGGTHNGLIVAMKDYLVVFDAPINEWQSKWTIDAAKSKYPGKPVKYLVLSHHHMDHTGGARTYVAEGATIIVPSPVKAHFEKDFAAAHTVNPDELQRNPRPAAIVEIGDRMSLKDESGEIRLYRIVNPHVDGMLIGHIVNDNLVWVVDLYSPGATKESNPLVVAFSEALKKLGITGARYAGGHGGNGDQAQLDAVLAQK